MGLLELWGIAVVAAALHKGRIQVGIRPFDPYRDLGPVAELISAAFGNRLDPGGQAALAEMRRAARWGSLLGWLYWPGWGGTGSTPGFVWVEQGRVVGNVSLRRSIEWGGFLIGNVAVHPDWQRRGIGRRLIEATLEDISARGGRWVGLEVETDNEAALGLYKHLRFREVGGMLHMLRPAGLPWAGESPSHSLLRRGRSGDSAALMALARASATDSQRPLLELRRQDYQPGWDRALDHWFEGRREVWWVIEGDGAICGAVRALREVGRRPDRLEVLVSAEHENRFETVLVQRGIASLRDVHKKAVEVLLPKPLQPLVAALQTVGFQELRVLIQMRLDVA